jgi:hypothetical protein
MLRSYLFLSLLLVACNTPNDKYPMVNKDSSANLEPKIIQLTDGFNGVFDSQSRITEKKINDIIAVDQILHIIVLDNRTNAMHDLHIDNIIRAIKRGSTMKPVKFIDKDGYTREAPGLKEGFMFDTIFETKQHEFIRFKRYHNKILVITAQGTGLLDDPY